MDKIKPDFIRATLFSILNFCQDDTRASLLLNDLNLDESLFVIYVKTATDTKKFNFLTEELQSLMMRVIKEKIAHKNWRLSLQESVSSINKIRSIRLSKIPYYAAKPKIQEPQAPVKDKSTSTASAQTAQTAAQYVASTSTTDTKYSMPIKQSNVLEPQARVKDKTTSTASAQTAQTAAQYVASTSTTDTKDSTPNKQSIVLEPQARINQLIKDKPTSTATAQTAAQYVASTSTTDTKDSTLNKQSNVLKFELQFKSGGNIVSNDINNKNKSATDKSLTNDKSTINKSTDKSKSATDKCDLPNFSRGMYKQKVRLVEGMSMPIESEKAKRMMQLMGWEGGALGIRGEGIVEPIAPALYLKPYAGLGAEQAVNQIPKDQPKTKNKITKQEKNDEKLESRLLYNVIRSRLHELILWGASEITVLHENTLSKKQIQYIKDLIYSINLRNPHNVTKDLVKVYEFMSKDTSVGVAAVFQARTVTIRKVHIDEVLTTKQKSKMLNMMLTIYTPTVGAPIINQNFKSQIHTQVELTTDKPIQNGYKTYQNSAHTNQNGVQIFHDDVQINQNGAQAIKNGALLVQNGTQPGAHATQNGASPNQNAVRTSSYEVIINQSSFYRVEELLNINIGTKKKDILLAYKYLILENVCDFVKRSDTEVIINFDQVISKNLYSFIATLVDNINKKRLISNITCAIENKIHSDILSNILDGCKLDLKYHNTNLKIRLRKVFADSTTHNDKPDGTICNRSVYHESLTANGRSSSRDVTTKTPELIILDSEDEKEVNSFNARKGDFTCDTNLNLIPVLNNVNVDLELPETEAVISVFPDDETEFDKELRELEVAIAETKLIKNDSYIKRNRCSSNGSNCVISKKAKFDLNTDIKYIFIVPKNYPFCNITRDTVNSLQNLICSSINETTDNLPLLECHGIQNGALIYCCHNEKTYCWMKDIVAEFELDVTEFLDVIKTKSSQVVAMKINTCLDQDIAGILKNIKVYYPNLDLLFWWLIKKEVNVNSVVFIMEIDRKSLEFIYFNDFSLFVGFDKAHFSIVWDM